MPNKVFLPVPIDLFKNSILDLSPAVTEINIDIACNSVDHHRACLKIPPTVRWIHYINSEASQKIVTMSRLHFLGRIKFNWLKNEEACEYFQADLKCNPASVESLTYLAQIKRFSLDFEEASQLLQKALTLIPSYPEEQQQALYIHAWHELLLVSISLKNSQEAFTCFNRLRAVAADYFESEVVRTLFSIAPILAMCCVTSPLPKGFVIPGAGDNDCMICNDDFSATKDEKVILLSEQHLKTQSMRAGEVRPYHAGCIFQALVQKQIDPFSQQTVVGVYRM